MADDDLLGDAEFAKELAEPEPQRLHAHQIELAAEQPARVVFAKPRRLHQRARFVVVAVGQEVGLRLWKQEAASTVGEAPGRYRRRGGKGMGADKPYCRKISTPSRCSTLASRFRKLAPNRLTSPALAVEHQRLDVVHVKRAEADAAKGRGRRDGIAVGGVNAPFRLCGVGPDPEPRRRRRRRSRPWSRRCRRACGRARPQSAHRSRTGRRRRPRSTFRGTRRRRARRGRGERRNVRARERSGGARRRRRAGRQKRKGQGREQGHRERAGGENERILEHRPTSSQGAGLGRRTSRCLAQSGKYSVNAIARIER